MSPSYILNLPPDIVIEDILRRLPASSILSFQLSCRHFHSIINASPLLNYLKELAFLGLVDNPGCSYSYRSLPERSAVLKEHISAWKELNWKWEKSDIKLPVRDGTPSILFGQANVLYFKTDVEYGDPPNTSIWSMSIPSNEHEDLAWEEVKFHGRYILTSALDAEGRDLLICITSSQNPQPLHRANDSLQIHFLTHSTHQPHPKAFAPVHAFSAPDPPANSAVSHTDHPSASAALCGNYLAYTVYCSHDVAKRFTVMDWTTGQSIHNVSSNRNWGLIPGFLFLRDDLLLVGDPSYPSQHLEIYHVPPMEDGEPKSSSASSASSSMVLLAQLHLPALRYKWSIDAIRFSTNPRAAYVASDSSIPYTTSTQPYLNDPLSSVIDIEVVLEGYMNDHHPFHFIIHWQTMFDHAMSALEHLYQKISDSTPRPSHTPSLPEEASSSLNPVIDLPWDTWGPDNVRVLPPISHAYCPGRNHYKAMSKGDALEVLDFGPAEPGLRRLWLDRYEGHFGEGGHPKREGDVVGNPAPPAEQLGPDIRAVSSIFEKRLDMYAMENKWNRPFSQDLHTRLPYVKHVWKRLVNEGDSCVFPDYVYLDETNLVYLEVDSDSEDPEPSLVGVYHLG